MEIKSIAQQYSAYICKNYDEKLHAGQLLADAGTQLLKMIKETLNDDVCLHRTYLMRKIAGDLLRQVENMAHTKQYDCAPVLKEYTYLAFNLAYSCCNYKPDRKLLPFLAHVLYYEEYNKNKDYYNQLKELYQQSLNLEKKYLENLTNSDNPVYATDIWGF